jgi:hypothetical protein
MTGTPSTVKQDGLEVNAERTKHRGHVSAPECRTTSLKLKLNRATEVGYEKHSVKSVAHTSLPWMPDMPTSLHWFTSETDDKCAQSAILFLINTEKALHGLYQLF